MQSDNMFVYLAQSFLHGRLDLTFVPTYQDLSLFHGKFYAFWPPLCSFLLMPLVLIHGVYVGDRWLDALFVALIALSAWLIIGAVDKKYGSGSSVFYKILLIIFLSFGTSSLIFTLIGSHWYMAQLAAATMMFFAILFSFILKPGFFKWLIMGTFWALAILSRMHLIMAFPVFFYIVLSDGLLLADKKMSVSEIIDLNNWRSTLLPLSVLLIPMFLALSFIGWYDWARFGSIFDNGIRHHNMAYRFLSDYKKYGYFSLHYFLYNSYYTILRVPILQNIFKEPISHWTEGYSIFYQSPVLLYALLTLRKIKDGFVACLWCSILLVAFPILCVMGTGWVQFGARYLFDLLPLFFPLVIIGSRSKASPVLITLVILSVSINMHGLCLLKQFFGQPL